MTQHEISIAGRRIADDQPPFIIAELSANHLGDIGRALKSIDVAAECGADAVKFQTYTPDTLTIDVDNEYFRITGGLWDGRTLYDLYGEAFTPYEWHAELFSHARSRGIIPLSTPFDETAIELLEGLDAPAYKIASFEVIDLPLVAAVARRGKPMIISTGMADLAEIQAAVQTARDNGASEIILLHCTSAYPAPFTDARLRTIPHMKEAFQVIGGLSDHTPGTAAAVASVALGARVIEKHFTLSRDDGGPDSSFSLEPDELVRLVSDCRSAWEALGSVSYNLSKSERGSEKFRRSLFVVQDVKAGEAITPAHVRSIRPGYGMPPKHLPDVIGRKAAHDLSRGQPLTWKDLD
ncbi:pseudaminic acid synthase [Rhizobium leguminosarum]|uniref:pseudaminic acid synthase n=1 Tax=Rhizobium leguminosarum TaxID=384 RepID=UPI001AE51E5A|nr:pseudaminic acid synthase [Rhizobium leguminosarum]MBP2447319.1 N-acetylneuraminate synthase [Rhizobium leguminosarum]